MANAPKWKTSMNPTREVPTPYLDPVVDHPLKTHLIVERVPKRVLGSTPSTGRSTPVSSISTVSDPLSLAIKKLEPLSEIDGAELDPLSRIALEADDDIHIETDNVKIPNRMNYWSQRKGAILQKYTTTEKLSMVTSFLSEGDKVVVRAQSTAVDKVQHRLEQLDSFEENSQCKLDLSQTEYIKKIEQLNQELVTAWHSEQRVKALKIAIQCAKMLADTDVLQFYPSKFVLITDILDCFGRLVYDRLKAKSAYFRPGTKEVIALPENFTPNMVPDSAKETCLNWFYKIASIRELIPRLYVELALIKSYYFVSPDEAPQAIARLTETVQGIGNPLVAIYARCYICRMGESLRVKDNGHYRRNFECFLETYQHLFSRRVKLQLNDQKLSLSIYMTLYTPALDYIMENLVVNCPESVFNQLLAKCKTYSNSSLILNTIMSGFSPNYISERTIQFLNMIAQCTDDGIPLHSLLKTLGLCVSVSNPPIEHHKSIFNAVWSNITQLQDSAQYISCAGVWIKFVIHNFSSREVNAILGDVIERMNRTYDLKPLMDALLTGGDMESLLVMDNFLPLLNLVNDQSVKVAICKEILLKFTTSTNDPVIINALMFLANILYDNINALTPEDETRQVSEILSNVIQIVDYGKDFESQLRFYVDARGSFSNVDKVLSILVQRVCKLSESTNGIVKGVHTRKTADFVRACAAYAFITIPSIENSISRLKLYLLAGQVALHNQCYGQADASFHAILTTLQEIDGYDNDEFLLGFLRKFLSTLLVVPDNPERGVLSTIRQLLNLLRNHLEIYQLGCVYVNVIDLLTIMTMESYPYHVNRVESNDALFGTDPRFIKEIDEIISKIVSELLEILKQLGGSRKQFQLAFDLFVRVAIRSGEYRLKLAKDYACIRDSRTMGNEPRSCALGGGKLTNIKELTKIFIEISALRIHA